ncbi:AsmA family protein [Vibrio chagasii]|nr:AsmA family protein [Vibrio chagasii]
MNGRKYPTHPTCTLASLWAALKDTVQLLQDKKLGLWQGKLIASANDAFKSILSTLQPVVEMNSEQRKWTLEKNYILLSRNGYIEANATLDFNQISKPWSVDISADGFTISPCYGNSTYHSMQQVIVVELQASSLYGDSLMLGYSTTGQLKGSDRQGVTGDL